MFVIQQNDSVTGPFPWTAARRRLKALRPQVAVQSSEPTGPLSIDNLTILPAVLEPPVHDPATHKIERTGWTIESDQAVAQYTLHELTQEEIDARIPHWAVRKLLVIDRLQAIGLFDAAVQTIDSQSRLVQERWKAAVEIDHDDPTVTALLNAIGADPAVILAEE